MKFMLKLFATPVALALAVITAFFSFILSVSQVFFSIAATLVFVASVILFVSGETLGGGLYLAIAFLVSPFGLPALAEFVVRCLDSLGGALKLFIFS